MLPRGGSQGQEAEGGGEGERPLGEKWGEELEI